MKLIDKDIIVAEIEKRLNANGAFDTSFDTAYTEDVGMCNAYKSILSFVDNLETKEVDLEREIKLYKMRNPIIEHREGSLYDYMSDVAKHFFELGLKAQKEGII